MVDANDLVYLRARYYHPGLGVFTGLDPIEQVNRYQYVDSNPTNFIDPSGLCPIWDPDCIKKGLGEGLAVVAEGWNYASDTTRRGTGEVLGAFADEVWNPVFVDSSLSQTIRANPEASIAIAVGSIILIPVTLAGGAAVTVPILLSAAAGSGIGGATGTGYGVAMYEMAVSGQCGCDAKNAALAMGKGAFVSRVRETGMLYGMLYGGLYGSGPAGQIISGGVGVVQGGQAVVNAGQDINQNGANPCNVVNGLLGIAGVLGSTSIIQQGISDLLPRSGQVVLFNKHTGEVRVTRTEALQQLENEIAYWDILIWMDDEAVAYLDWYGSHVKASTLDDSTIAIRPNYRNNIRVLREEVIHTHQNRLGMIQSADDVVLMEIYARQIMVRFRHEFGLTNDEVRAIINEIRKIRSTGEY
jgi:hypothetical protein